MQSRLIDMVGQKYGKLTVIGPHKHIKDQYNHSRTLWQCQCECGNKLWTNRDFLRRKNKVQCKDCNLIMLANNRKKTKEEGLHFKLPSGEASFNHLFCTYKNNARNRNRIFTLTKEQFRILTKSNCTYCNRVPEMYFGEIENNGYYMYNGIDRKNNSEGYTTENSLSCCSPCNKLKHILGYQQFLNHIKSIYMYMHSKGEI